MFTTIAYIENIDEAGVFANIEASIDQHMDYRGDLIRVPADMNRIMAAICFAGSTGERCRLSSPSLIGFQPIHVAPLNQVLVPTGNDVVDMHKDNLIPLESTENLECEINANPAAPEWHSVGVWLTDSEIDKVMGDVRPVPFSITLSLTAGQWGISTITLDDELPAGNYDVVGGRLECAVGTIARFVFTKARNRPGMPCSADEDFKNFDQFRYGNLGVWGPFDNISLPQVEVLCTVTTGSATYRGIMDVVRR